MFGDNLISSLLVSKVMLFQVTKKIQVIFYSFTQFFLIFKISYINYTDLLYYGSQECGFRKNKEYI